MRLVRSRINSFIYHLFVMILGFGMLYPILWTISSSLKPKNEIFADAASLIPSTLRWDNYVKGWSGFGGVKFDVFFGNTFFITILVVIGTLFSSSLVAFGFARLKFRFQSVLFACLLGTIMLPNQVTLIPQYLLFKSLGWVNTYLPLIVPAYLGGTPFLIFLMVQFIRGIPRELDKAAVIDGCSTFGIFFRIVLPLARPVLATVAIFSFYWTWSEFYHPLIYLSNTKMFTISLALRMFSDPNSVSEWGPMFAMSFLSLIPVILVFFFFQRHLVQGVSTTGLK